MANESATAPLTGIDLLSVPLGKQVKALRRTLIPGMKTEAVASVEQIATALINCGVCRSAQEAGEVIPQLDGNKYVFARPTMGQGPVDVYMGFTKRADGNYDITRNRATDGVKKE